MNSNDKAVKAELSIIEAKFEAQKIAFAPLFFQAIITLKQTGILKLIGNYKKGVAIAEVIKQSGINRYGVMVLLEAAASANVVELLAEDHVRLTKVGFVLNSDLMTEVNLNFVNDVCYDGAKFLSESIISGKPQGLKTIGNWSTIYEGLSQLPSKVKKSWFDFDHYYSDNAFAYALEIVFAEKPSVIFDIGGNTGKFALACCTHDPNVRIEIFDLPGQLAVSKKNAEENNLLSRIDFHKINLLDASQQIPNGADAIWMSQFLDCFSEDEIISILKNVSRAAGERTFVYILETFIDNQKFEAANYSLVATSLYFTTMANGNSKMYRLDVMQNLIQAAGLEVVESFPLIGDSYHTVLKCVKA